MNGDSRTTLLVALLIGLVALTAIAGTVLLLAQGRGADAALVGLAGTALGYLAGLTSNGSSSTPQPVTVRQPAGEPVPTVEV